VMWRVPLSEMGWLEELGRIVFGGGCERARGLDGTHHDALPAPQSKLHEVKEANWYPETG
jgi:hypothetical protein